MWIKNGRIIDNDFDGIGDIHIENGRIEGVYPGGAQIPAGDEVIDATGMWVIPGLVDMHVHFRDPGYEYKEDIRTGGLAAASGGVTTVACMANTDPVNDNPSVTQYILEKARETSAVRVLPVGAVTKGLKGKDLAEIGLMKEAGIVAVSDDGAAISDSALLRRALEYASDFGLTLISHCQDPSLSGKGVMNEGALSSMLGLAGIPSIAEDVMVARDLIVAEYTDLPVHITHVSTGTSLDIVRSAKKRGVKVTCDVTPHHLLLTEDAVKDYDTNAKMYPPLRLEEDRLALIEGVKDGVVDCIATDHAPHSADEKALDFDLAPFGMIGLQTLLPCLMELHEGYDIGIGELLRCVGENPARILGVDGGRLLAGERADIAVIDPAARRTFTENMIMSRSKNSAFLGKTIKGEVVYTLCMGRVVYSRS